MAGEVEVSNGGTLELEIAPVRHRVGGAELPMLAYNGSVPGPTLRVRQHSVITVDVANHTDSDQTVHWHGLRLDNRFDGVPHETQDPIAPGQRFTYELRFPDAGLYWYHPHVREDFGQEMGLYGNIIVEPVDPEYWPPVGEELVVALDDMLIEDGRMAPFDRAGATRTMMGRFGNVMLTAGQTDPTFDVVAGEPVRLLLTNTANTRVFNISVPGTTMKLVGGDSGRVEHEELVDTVILAPSERAVVDVLFPDAGTGALEHHTPDRTYSLATFAVGPPTGDPSTAARFLDLRRDTELQDERARLAEHRPRDPDYTLQLLGTMDMTGMDHDMGGMDHDMGGMDHDVAAAAPTIEWEDDMATMNAMSDQANMTWQLIDAETGSANTAIDWTLRVGDRVKIRLDNTLASDHQMHHPFHIHGAGRFLVLDRDGAEEPNLVWKDTVLVRGGEVVHILLDVTNPGRWMAHCHIAEHNENGMMFSFDVVEPAAGSY